MVISSNFVKSKKLSRLRRAKRLRIRLKSLLAVRLVIHRSSRHIYAQIISSDNSLVLVSGSSLEKKNFSALKYTGNKESSTILGEIIAKRALEKGIKKVSFDRSGFKYHGRVKALAEAARKFGLDF